MSLLQTISAFFDNNFGGAVTKSGKREPLIYLDHAAITPIDPVVAKVVKEAEAKLWMNPSSLHAGGVAAKKALEDARTRSARTLNARPEEIYFTASGTEANNIALGGTIAAQLARFSESMPSALGVPQIIPHILISATEHPSVRETVAALAAEKCITFDEVKVGQDGIIDLDDLKEKITSETFIVSVMMANNETGVIQPIAAIAKIIRHERKMRTEARDIRTNLGLDPLKDFAMPLYFHTDAAQAASYMTLDMAALGVDMLTLDAHKVYGPRGIGLLWVRSGVPLSPMIVGGGQEKGLRSGTENVPAALGLAKALEISAALRENESARLTVLRDYFAHQIIEKVTPLNPALPIVIIGHPTERLPNTLSVALPIDDAEWAVLQLDAHGIAASTRSACTEGTEGVKGTEGTESAGSTTLRAMGIAPEIARRVVRFTLGRSTTQKDIDKVIATLLSLRHGRTY